MFNYLMFHQILIIEIFFEGWEGPHFILNHPNFSSLGSAHGCSTLGFSGYTLDCAFNKSLTDPTHPRWSVRWFIPVHSRLRAVLQNRSEMNENYHPQKSTGNSQTAKAAIFMITVTGYFTFIGDRSSISVNNTHIHDRRVLLNAVTETIFLFLKECDAPALPAGFVWLKAAKTFY